jgi:signal transduction histidine kinase
VLTVLPRTTDKVLAAKQTQHALERAEQSSAEWQAIFQAASQGLAVIDEDLRIIAMNRAATEILGLTEDEEIPVMGDGLRLSQLIWNLLSNAVKYSPEGTTVEVRLLSDGNNALLQVLDEGRGIPADKLDKVFDGFYRPADVKDCVSGSIGLGLYISRATARAHGGDLWAENRPGGVPPAATTL